MFSARLSYLPHLLLGLMLMLPGLSPAAAQDDIEEDLVIPRLLADVEAVVPGKEFTLGVEFTMKPHWHIYWRNPGDSGLPPEFTWKLPESFKQGEMMWPVPHKIEMGGLVTYGYEDRVILLMKVTPPADLKPGQDVKLEADLTWLVCKDICLPGKGAISLTLPVTDAKEAPLDNKSAVLFTVSWQNLPSPQSDWTVQANRGEGDVIELLLTPKEGAEPPKPENVYFYANEGGVISPNAKQPLSPGEGGSFVLTLEKGAAANEITKLPGVLVSDTAWVAGQQRLGKWEIAPTLEGSVSQTATPPAGSEDAAGTTGAETSTDGTAGTTADRGESLIASTAGFEGWLLNLGFPGLLALAFLGGLVLNIMPCVLPVLSLKVFSLIKHSEQGQGKAVAHGLSYAGGVIASFLLLAVLLLILRAAFEGIGWGFQTQNPIFVTFIVLLFFLFGLNLFGVFEIGTSLVGADAKFSGRGDLIGSFVTGILAAVVGAPCIGPFLGPAMGLAIQLSTLQVLVFFSVIGLGLASPFLLLAFYPPARVIIPKPGAWMEAFKQFMGFLLMLAAVYFLWVLASLSGTEALFWVLLSMIVLAMAAWVYGRWSLPHKSEATRWVARAVAVVLLLTGGWMAVEAAQTGYDRLVAEDMKEASGSALAADQSWQDWSPERVQEALDSGKPVFVDFTAAWCLICQSNKVGVLKTTPVEAAFEEANVVTLEADWTRYNPQITKELEKFNRAGVPLYLLYNPEQPEQPEVLPQTLTQQGVIAAVEKLAN